MQAGKEKKTVNMTLNSLPSRTWNRLKINESFVEEDFEKFKDHRPDAAGALPAGVRWDAASSFDYEGAAVKTGVGSDIEKLTAPASAGLLETDAGVVMTEPLFLHYGYAGGENAVSRLVLHAAKNSCMKVVLLLDTPARKDGGTMALQTKILADDGAQVKIYQAQLLGSGCTLYSDFGGVCGKEASAELVRLDLGAKNLYAGAWIDLAGNESRFDADLGYYVRSGDHFDMNYAAIHRGCRSGSLMEASGTLEDGASKTFRGTIDFKQGCSGSKGTENENILLLGDDMVNRTVPLILCSEEDVEGNHGASIGQLDEKILFYMGTRGISPAEAQRIISASRIEAICEKIPDEAVREAVRAFEL